MKIAPHFARVLYPYRLTGLMLILAIALWLIAPLFAQSPTEITILMNALEAAQWKPLVRDFEQQNPDLRLQIVEGPNATNLIEDLYTSAFLLGNSPYDLVYMDVAWVSKFAAAGWLKDLSDRTSPSELNEFLEAAITAGRYQGKLYALPHRSDAGMLYYRKDLLDKLGAKPPTTFTELVQTAKTLQSQQLVPWGYVWQGRQYEGLAAMFVEVLHGHSGFWINPTTEEVGLDRSEAIAAVEFLRQTITSGLTPPGVTTYGEEESRFLFQNNQVAFLRNWPYVWALSKDSPVAGKLGSVPMVHVPNASSGACLGGWELGVSAMSKHPDEAWRVIKFFTSEATQRQYILNTGYVPSRSALFTDSQIVAAYSHYPQLLQVVQQAALRPPIPQYAQASDILQRYLSAALTGSLSPQQAMQAAAGETRRLLGRNLRQANLNTGQEAIAG